MADTTQKKNKKKISTTKLLILFLFLNCTAVEIFTGYVTIENLSLARDVGTMLDFTPLVTLVGAVISEVLGFGVYALKSLKENSCGGIVYDTAMKEYENDNLG